MGKVRPKTVVTEQVAKVCREVELLILLVGQMRTPDDCERVREAWREKKFESERGTLSHSQIQNRRSKFTVPVGAGVTQACRQADKLRAQAQLVKIWMLWWKTQHQQMKRYNIK